MNDLKIPANVMALIECGRTWMVVDVTKHPQYKDWCLATFKIAMRKWFL